MSHSLQQDFAAVSASEADVADAIRRTKAAYDYVLDPHTACAFVAAERVAPAGNTVVLSTAHPAKFPDAIEAITGTRPALPAHQVHLMTDAERFETLPNSLSSVQNFVLKHCRVATGTTL
jgi:threonine synthase